MTNTRMLEVAQFLLDKEKERILECKAMMKLEDFAEAKRLVDEAQLYDEARDLIVKAVKARLGE